MPAKASDSDLLARPTLRRKGPVLFADKYYVSDCADICRLELADDGAKVFMRDGTSFLMPGKDAAKAVREWILDQRPVGLRAPAGPGAAR